MGGGGGGGRDSLPGGQGAVLASVLRMPPFPWGEVGWHQHQGLGPLGTCWGLGSHLPLLLADLQVKGLALHPELFSIENGLLTPTMKAKRPELRNYFRSQIDELYSTIKV